MIDVCPFFDFGPGESALWMRWWICCSLFWYSCWVLQTWESWWMEPCPLDSSKYIANALGFSRYIPGICEGCWRKPHSEWVSSPQCEVTVWQVIMVDVSVFSACWNKIPQTEGRGDNKNVFFSGLEAGSLRSEPAWWMKSSLGLQTSCRVLMRQKALKDPSGVSLIKWH